MREYIRLVPYVCREITKDLRRRWYYLPALSVGTGSVVGLFFDESRFYSTLFLSVVGACMTVSEILYGKPTGIFRK